MPRTIQREPIIETGEDVEPLTYLEEHHPAFVAELLALAEQIDDDE